MSFDAEQIRQRMSEIRDELPSDVVGIVEQARRLTDWRYYVKSFPWASVAAAALVGYAIVPRRKEPVRGPDVETLAKLARQNKLVIQTPAEETAKQGLLAGVIGLFGTLLVQAGKSYALKQADVLFSRKAQTAPGAAPSPRGRSYGNGYSGLHADAGPDF